MTVIRRREFLKFALRSAAVAPVLASAWTDASSRQEKVGDHGAKLDARLKETKAKLPRPHPSSENKGV